MINIFYTSIDTGCVRLFAKKLRFVFVSLVCPMYTVDIIFRYCRKSVDSLRKNCILHELRAAKRPDYY